RDDVEGSGALGDADRVVDLRHANDDPVTDADALRLDSAGCQEDLRRGAVRVLLQEVVLDGPYLVEAKLIGEPHLFERPLVDSAFGLPVPRARDRNLVEDSELHRPPPAVVGSIVTAYWIVSRRTADKRDKRDKRVSGTSGVATSRLVATTARIEYSIGAAEILRD